MCTTAWMSKFVKKCRVYIGPSSLFDSDHRIVVMDVTFPSTKKHLKKYLSRRPNFEEAAVTDFVALRKDPEMQRLLTEKIDAGLEDLLPNDVNELNDKIVEVVKESVQEVCPKMENSRKKEPWEDQALQEMTKDLRRTNDGKEVRRKQKLIRKRRRTLKNRYYKELADNINNAAEAREVEKEFALAKKHSAFRKGQPKAISNEKLKSHFEHHFKAKELPILPEIQYPHL